MITERDEEQRDERAPLVLSLVASTIINLLAWVLVIWGSGLHQKPPVVQLKEREEVVASTSIRLERRTIPQPEHAITQPQTTQPQPRPQPVHRREQAQPLARPTEIARIVQHAPPQPRPQKQTRATTTLESQLAQQEQAFQREAQQLNASHTLSIATNAPQPPSSFHRAYMDISGRNERESAQTIIDPLPGKHWYANGMSCYYVHYYAQYSGGGTEEGNIPWPLCYPAAHDAMLPLDRQHALPIPAPPPGYVLPAGTTLQPLLQDIYTGRITEGHNG